MMPHHQQQNNHHVHFNAAHERHLHSGGERGPHLLASPIDDDDDHNDSAYFIEHDSNMIHMTTDDPAFLSLSEKTRLLFGDAACHPSSVAAMGHALERQLMDAENISPSATVSQKAQFFAVQQKKVNTPQRTTKGPSSMGVGVGSGSTSRGSSSISTPSKKTITTTARCTTFHGKTATPLRRNDSLTNIQGAKSTSKNVKPLLAQSTNKGVIFATPSPRRIVATTNNHNNGSSSTTFGKNSALVNGSAPPKFSNHRRSVSSPSPSPTAAAVVVAVASSQSTLPSISQVKASKDRSTLTTSLHHEQQPQTQHRRSKSTEYVRFNFSSISPQSAQKVIMDNPATRAAYLANQKCLQEEEGLNNNGGYGGSNCTTTTTIKRYGAPQLAGRLCVDRFPDAPQHFLRTWTGGAEYYSPNSVFKVGSSNKRRSSAAANVRGAGDSTDNDAHADNIYHSNSDHYHNDAGDEFVEAMQRETEHLEKMAEEEEGVMVNESDADDMQHPHEGNYCITSCPTTTTFASFSDELQLNTANSKPRQQRLVIKATKTDDENGDMQSLPCLPTSSSACYTFDEEDEQPFSTQKQQYHDNHETATKSIATRLTVNTTGQMDDHAALKSTNDGRHASHQSQPPPPSNFKTDEKVESSCACVIM